MWMWIIKTEHGYLLEDGGGRIIKYFDMACNCKAYCMEQEIVTVYLRPKCDLDSQLAYEHLTGKTLWWNRSL